MTRASFFRRVFSSDRRPQSKTARRSRLAVESLEDRAVPAVFTVNTLVDENNGIGVGSVSLREAIAAANGQAGDDAIQIGVTGTINLTGELPALSSNIAITGPGAGALTISGENATRVFQIDAGVSAALSGLTIANGKVTSNLGGGVYNSGTLTVTDCTFAGNSASSGVGGGIDNSGTLTVTNCTFADNSANHGGGIASTGALTVTNCTFANNLAGGGGGNGGGIFSMRDTLTVTNCTFSGNAALRGGGIYSWGGPLTVTNSTFAGNSAAIGGGIAGSGTVTNCTFAGNSAARNGGAILGSGAVTNCTFSGNSAGSEGGGIFSYGTLVVTNSTFSGNSALSSGGGIVNANVGTLTLNNNIVANSPSGGDVRNAGTIAGSHNLIGDGSGGLADTITGDPLLGPLQDTGGPTQTFALLPGSPAINAGSDALVPARLATDQRGPGFPRVINVVDIGAVEAVTLVVDTADDVDNGNYAAGDLSLR